MTARLATPCDVDLMTGILADAFAHDPMWSTWAFPNRVGRNDNRAAVFRLFVEGALRYSTSWLAAGDGAVAVWIPPGGSGLDTMQEVMLESALRRRVGPTQTRRILHGLEMFEQTTPEEPHYYLSLLGTNPTAAGRGLGRRLLADNLTVIDRERAAAFLDCADDLVPFYESFGFRVVSSLVLPDGPHSNGMWRPPRT